ncbi:TauD/TfdA family dioxygenase [Paenibacillus cineris]|uniref:TauD/TfdA family dioxygenase n=1 Tax=Paenibacillus cineris TaxID=237530 RepID=UPI001B20148C|nr:TauD/TfdA family dioxygenase [Paenibacillus cineris]GIO64069.1 hypothetical protein J43TS9_56430 [Paenibacillus cineris]
MNVKDIIESVKLNGFFEFDYYDDLLYLAKQLGTPVPSRRNESVVSLIKVLNKEEAKVNSLSAIYGKGAFPYHTEAAYRKVPPRYVILRMQRGNDSRPTLLKELYSNLNDDSLNILKNEIWIYSDNKETFLSTVISKAQNNEIITRFDKDCMTFPLKRDPKAMDLVYNALQYSPTVKISWSSGKTIVFDNWRMLHARGENFNNIDCEDRILERILILGD